VNGIETADSNLVRLPVLIDQSWGMIVGDVMRHLSGLLAIIAAWIFCVLACKTISKRLLKGAFSLFIFDVDICLQWIVRISFTRTQRSSDSQTNTSEA